MINKLKPVAEITLLEHTAVALATAALSNPNFNPDFISQMLSESPERASDLLDAVGDFIEKSDLVER